MARRVSRVSGRLGRGHPEAAVQGRVAEEEPPRYTMKYMLDTDTVSCALRGQGEVAGRLRAQKPSDLCLSAITLAELRYGADRKGSRKLHRLIDAFSGSVEVVPFDETAATEFGRLAGLLADR